MYFTLYIFSCILLIIQCNMDSSMLAVCRKYWVWVDIVYESSPIPLPAKRRRLRRSRHSMYTSKIHQMFFIYRL